MLFRTLAATILGVVLFLAAAPAQVVQISSTAATGLDISLYSSSVGYTFYAGKTPEWGNLQNGGYVEYTLNTTLAGSYAVQLYYSNGTTSSGTVTALVNGGGAANVPLPSSGAWGTFVLSPATALTFPAGHIVLRLAASNPVQPYNLAGILITPIAPTAPVAAATPAASPARASNPLFGLNFYVNPYSLAAKNTALSCSNGQQISKIAAQSQSVWFGNWNTDPHGDIATVMQAAAAKGTVPVLTVYNIVNRDCGGYSSGGAATDAAYYSWIGGLSSGIGNGKAIVILEPDAISQYNTASCLNTAQKTERLTLLNNAIASFAANAPNALVYLDAGPPNALSAAVIGPTLVSAGIAKAAGFAVNVSNYETTADSVAYGTAISGLTGGKHFVVDTSRNGVGPTSDHQWCNPTGRGLGLPPQATPSGLVDGYLWVQNPGTSDGTCNGGAPAGTFDVNIACTLLQNSAF